jgi:hypothetical protein
MPVGDFWELVNYFEFVAIEEVLIKTFNHSLPDSTGNQITELQNPPPPGELEGALCYKIISKSQSDT